MERGAGRHRPHRARVHREPLRAGALRGGAGRRRRHPRTPPAATYDPDDLVDEWMKSVGQGVPGYETPKVAVGAVVGNDEGEILLVQRSDSGVWLYPTGWADIGYSAVRGGGEGGAGGDGHRVRGGAAASPCSTACACGFTRIPLYSLVFHCRAIGGELKAAPARDHRRRLVRPRRPAPSRSPASSSGASSPSPPSGARPSTCTTTGPATPPWRRRAPTV